MIHVLDEHHQALATRSSGLGNLGELSIVFLTDRALAQLHAQFLDDPTTTDVITFEGEPTLGSAGEICVSVDTAARYAREHRRDFSTELTLYVVHGWLHLAGYDDLAPAKKRVMRRAEAKAMRLLAREKSLPKFVLSSVERSS
jgi:probable rRNA maturation factor